MTARSSTKTYPTSGESFPPLVSPLKWDIYGTIGTVTADHRTPQAPGLTPAVGTARSGSGSESRSEWEAESVHHRIVVALAAAPASRSEIAAAIGHKSITG